MQNLWKAALAVCAGVCLAFGIFGCENSLESIKDRRVLHIGISKATPPFGYVDSSGEFAGLEVLLGRKLAKDLLGDENRVCFSAITDTQGLELLDSLGLDIILSNIYNPQSNSVAFASPFIYTTTSVMGKVNQPQGIQELAGAKILVRSNSVAQAYFQANYPKAILEICADLRECLAVFERDDLLYFAEDNVIITLLVRQNPDFTISVPALGDPYPIKPLVKDTNTSLLTWLNKELSILHKEGFLQQAFDSAVRSYYDEMHSR